MSGVEWTDDEREAMTDALVMSSMSDHVGTDLAPVSRTVHAILAALAPFVATREAQAAAGAADPGAYYANLRAEAEALRGERDSHEASARDLVASLLALSWEMGPADGKRLRDALTGRAKS
ncbi:hypothetical protein [Ornithinimicrobium sufpigmenti]|uniref:hypothetical protein n=1 Tax=Ornithinimicrobium sufpigmenti TaxID=2508882 RepID=UPI001036B393|nr:MULTISPECIES: hypothetical protein [unclassified Ornithinimicrobium]